MNAHRQHQMDRETAERLLDGPAADPRGAPEGLVRLLSAVRAAPLPHELGGESAAVRAYHTARLDPAGHRPPRPARRRALTRLLSVKVTVAALAVGTTGGVALAAAQGVIPHPFRPATPVTSVTPADRPSAGADPDDTAPPPSAGAGRTPTPAEVALCRAYRGGDGNERDRLLRTPAGRELVTRAGGRGRVDGYCTGALAPGHQPPASPGAPGDLPATTPGGAPATGHGGTPTARPSSRPHGLPSTPALPTTAPTALPTAVPTPARPTGPAATVAVPPAPRSAGPSTSLVTPPDGAVSVRG